MLLLPDGAHPNGLVNFVDHLVLLSNDRFKLILELLAGVVHLQTQVIRHLAQDTVDSLCDFNGDDFGPLLLLLLVKLLHIAQFGCSLVGPLLGSIKVNVASDEFLDGVLCVVARFVARFRNGVLCVVLHKHDLLLKGVFLPEDQKFPIAFPFPVIAIHADVFLTVFDPICIFNSIYVGLFRCADPFRSAVEVFTCKIFPCLALDRV